MIEKKNNIYKGTLTDVEEATITRKGTSSRRIRVDGLWFTTFEPTCNTVLSLKGKPVHLSYWLSESDYGRTYRNVSFIEEATTEEETILLLREIRDLLKNSQEDHEVRSYLPRS